MPNSKFNIPRVKECIAYIETTYGGCKYLGCSVYNHERIYTFHVPRRTWAPITDFTTEELRFTFNHGW